MQNFTSIFSSLPENMRTIALDGVTYALLRHNGRVFRLGSVNPAWKELLGALPAAPGPEALESLAQNGVWLSTGASKKLAVMCCGMGSCWPGMGRGLYSNFPAAAAAMDELAEISGRDLLGIIEETDLEAISRTSAQMPYLFMLEYAQWRQFATLGLSPDLICGHSMGELVALCLAGVYDARAAWLLFEQRAAHITELEKKTANETGMLAVHAGEDIIRETLADWPALALANRNTARQFILGGPKPDLLAARKNLRKRRIPAMLLNVPLAFHNPAMRVLRNFSLRRLNALEMRAPAVPVLSNVTAGFYPETQAEICEYIANLDENAVAWNECAQAMRGRDGIEIFLELGPAETLCGLLEEIIPGCAAIPSDHREKETMAMRAALARLFALGQLDFEKILREKRSRPAHCETLAEEPAKKLEARPGDARAAAVYELIAKAGGRKASEITADMDLRYDLALRSSSFPHLLQEAEKTLGTRAEFESLLSISTVGDLAAALLGEKSPGLPKRQPLVRKSAPPPFRRFVARGQRNAVPELLQYGKTKIVPAEKDVILFFGGASRLCPHIWSALAPKKCILVVPENLESEFRALPSQWLETYVQPRDSRALEGIASEIHKNFGRLDGIFAMDSAPEDILALAACLESVNPNGWLCALRGFAVDSPLVFLREYNAWTAELAEIVKKPRGRLLALADDGATIKPDELGDLVALELAYGEGAAFWGRQPLFNGLGAMPQLFAAARDFPLAQPDAVPPAPSAAGQFQGISWWTRSVEAAAMPGGETDGMPDLETACEVAYARQLLAMLEGAHRLFPWLEPMGFSDLHFFEPIPLPPGIARECRLNCRARFWLMHEKVMTRIVETSLQLRKISENGRRLDDYAPCVAGICLLGADFCPVRPLVATVRDIRGDEIDAEMFYRAAGFNGRLVEKIVAVDPEKEILSGRLAPLQTPIAKGAKGDYAGYLQMFEGLVQAAALGVADSTVPEQCFARWRCGGVGYLNFDRAGLAARDDLRFYIRTVWRAEKFLRFNAQVGDSSGRVFLVAHNLEFDRA